MIFSIFLLGNGGFLDFLDFLEMGWGDDHGWGSLIKKCLLHVNQMLIKSFINDMYVHSEKSTKFTASKTYPFTRVGKLKAIVDPGWEPGVME